MNLAKELKKKRDAEARLDKNSPTKVFTEAVAGEPKYNDFSNLATKRELEDKSNKDHTHNITELVDVSIDYTGNAGKVLKVNNTEDGMELGEGGGTAEIPQATETVLGGIKAKPKTTESSEIAIDPSTGKLYAPSSGGGEGTDAESILTKPIVIPSFAGKDGYILAYNESTGEFYLKQDDGGGGGYSIGWNVTSYNQIELTLIDKPI